MLVERRGVLVWLSHRKVCWGKHLQLLNTCELTLVLLLAILCCLRELLMQVFLWIRLLNLNHKVACILILFRRDRLVVISCLKWLWSRQIDRSSARCLLNWTIWNLVETARKHYLLVQVDRSAAYSSVWSACNYCRSSSVLLPWPLLDNVFLQSLLWVACSICGNRSTKSFLSDCGSTTRWYGYGRTIWIMVPSLNLIWLMTLSATIDSCARHCGGATGWNERTAPIAADSAKNSSLAFWHLFKLDYLLGGKDTPCLLLLHRSFIFVSELLLHLWYLIIIFFSF